MTAPPCPHCKEPIGKHGMSTWGDPVCVWPCMHERLPGETRCESCYPPGHLTKRAWALITALVLAVAFGIGAGTAHWCYWGSC